MEVPKPSELLERVRSLPAAGPLMRRIDDGLDLYLVGGAVRDLLLGGTPYDLDLMVEGDVIAFAGSLGGEVRRHDRFGTLTVWLEGFTYDVAMARSERYPSPGALPEVFPATLAEDLLRRDFTVNSVAIALVGSRAGQLSAAPLALEDLGAGRLRVLHEQSFSDDPTRLLRLARYAGRLRFEIEPQTRSLALAAARSGAIQTASGPRIGTELRLLSLEQEAIAAFGCLRALGLDRTIHNQFGLRDEALAQRALQLLPRDGRADQLLLAVASREVPAPELGALLDRLEFEAPDREAILVAATRAQELASALAAARAPSEIAAVASVAGGPEAVALAGALGPSEQARAWLSELRHIRLEIDGSDLLAAGVPEGPRIGRGLRAALAAKLDGRAQGRESELQHALGSARASQ